MSLAPTSRRGRPILFLALIALAWTGLRISFLTFWPAADPAAAVEPDTPLASTTSLPDTSPRHLGETGKTEATQTPGTGAITLAEPILPPAPPAHLEAAPILPATAAAHNELWMDAATAPLPDISSKAGDSVADTARADF